MFRNVYLEGELGDKYGTEFRMRANTLQDAFKCLTGNFEDFRSYLLECHEKGIGFACYIAGKNITNEKELYLRFPKGDMIISPQPLGAKSDFGKALAVIAAVVLVVVTSGAGAGAAGGAAGGGAAGGAAGGTLGGAGGGGAAVGGSAASGGGAALSGSAGGAAGGAASASGGMSFAKYMGVSFATVGLSRLLMPDPSTDSQQDSSYLFQGSQHNLIEGDPVPLLYGELRIPGRPVSTIVRNETSYFYNGATVQQVPNNTGGLNPGESCGGGGSNTVTAPEPGDPNAVEDNFTCVYESTITENVLTNDFHPEGRSFSVDGYDDPEYGYFSASGVASDGAFTYNAASEFVGQDSFHYSVIDTDGNTHGARAYIDVQSPGEITVVDDFYTTQFNTAISGNVLANDSHSGGFPLTASFVIQSFNEPSDVLTLSSNGNFTYTPSSDFTGIFEFVYRTEDETGAGALGTAQITVLDQNQPLPGTYSVTAPDSINEGSSGTVNVSTTNVDDTTLYWTVTTLSGGDFTVSSGSFPLTGGSGSISITPDADSTTESNPEVATIQIRTFSTSGPIVATDSFNINDTSTSSVPEVISVAATGSTTTIEGSSTEFRVTTASIPDNTSLNWAVDHNTTSASDFVSDSGTVTITSNSGIISGPEVATDALTEGSEAYTITVSGTVSGTSVTATSATQYIVDPAAPAINSVVRGAAAVNEGSSVNFTVNTSNIPSGTELNWQVNNETTIANDFEGFIISGTVTIRSDGTGIVSVSTSSDSNNTEGNESFSITVSGTVSSTAVSGTSDSVTVTNIVINTAPNVENKLYENQTYGALVTGNLLTDTPSVIDAEGDVLTVSISENPNRGTVTLGANGAFTYEPSAPFEGSDSFEFTVSDGYSTRQAIVTITYDPSFAGTPTPDPTPGPQVPDYTFGNE